MLKYTFEERVRRLERIVYNMQRKKFEGGASGHMSHIHDNTDFTLRDIKGIIRSLFSNNGEIEDITEKLDGMNMQCTMNNNGEVVFVRNKSDLNSPKGGISVDEFANRWAGKDHVLNTYLSAADTITKVFNKIGIKFFNPNKNTKILTNCECISEGTTNILMYAKAQVDFHNLWVYTREDENSEWVKSDVTKDGLDVIDRACNGVKGAQLTPKVTIKVTGENAKLLVKYIKEIDAVFKAAGCSEYSTIEDYKRARFYSLCKNEYPWILENEVGCNALFNRWFNDDKKTISLRELKNMYHGYDISSIDYKQIIFECMRPLDLFFSKFGNEIISLCDGIVNAGAESAVIDKLSADLEAVVNEVRAKGSAEVNDKLNAQLKRLEELGNKLNATEGIVFKYKDRLMKCTGSFAAANQALGLRFRL